MNWILLIYVTASSLMVGSFLNVVIYRLPAERSVVVPGSACGSCGTPLLWWHNIPVLSYLLLRGRCGFCSVYYSPRYMLLELLTGVMGGWLWLHYEGDVWLWLQGFSFFCIGLCVFWIDVDHWIIPHSLNIFGTVLGLIFGLMLPVANYLMEPFSTELGGSLYSRLAGVIACVLFFLVVQKVAYLIARQEALGGGDVRYAAVLGAFLGVEMGLTASVVAFVLGGIFSIPLLLFVKNPSKKPVPFGTFMALGAILTLLYGVEMSVWCFG